MRAHWYVAESVGRAGNAMALQVACLQRCRWDEGSRNCCSRWGRADRHSLNRRGTHGMRCQWYRGVWWWSEWCGRTGGQARQCSWRKLEKRAEHDDEARSSIHVVPVCED